MRGALGACLGGHGVGAQLQVGFCACRADCQCGSGWVRQGSASTAVPGATGVPDRCRGLVITARHLNHGGLLKGMHGVCAEFRICRKCLHDAKPSTWGGQQARCLAVPWALRPTRVRPRWWLVWAVGALASEGQRRSAGSCVVGRWAVTQAPSASARPAAAHRWGVIKRADPLRRWG